MDAVFVELPAFDRRRADYITDDEYRRLQQLLLVHPKVAPVIPGTGGLRKLRWASSAHNKGKQGGVRVIYYAWIGGQQFWLFAIYGKNEASDLTESQKKALKKMLEAELKARKQ